jgi:hypothetical protein
VTPVDAASFDELVAEAAAAPVDGWDFSWLDGRATEARPSWGYQRLLGARLAAASASLDIQTGGGEVLAGAIESAAALGAVPPVMAATEGWPPNLALAAGHLHPLGVVVVGSDEASPLPFADEAFDLVSSRHPATVDWTEIARVLATGGTYLAQHVGGGANVELARHFLGPELAAPSARREHRVEAAAAEAAGLEVVQCRNERLELVFLDVGAVVWFLRKVIWTVPGFTVEGSLDRLRALHDRLTDEGAFRSTTSRTLFEVRKP